MTTATAAGAEALNPDRVICSTITLRHLPLEEALETIAGLGFTEIDLGALPGVCNHVPFELTADAVREVAEVVNRSGLTVRSVNADVGDLNRPLDAEGAASRQEHVQRLIELCQAIGSTGLVLPNGALQHEPIVSLEEDLALVADQLSSIQTECAAAGLELWVEAPHFFRLCYDLERTHALTSTPAQRYRAHLRRQPHRRLRVQPAPVHRRLHRPDPPRPPAGCRTRLHPPQRRQRPGRLRRHRRGSRRNRLRRQAVPRAGNP